MIFNCDRFKEKLTGLAVKKKAFLEDSSDEETEVNYGPLLPIAKSQQQEPI